MKPQNAVDATLELALRHKQEGRRIKAHKLCEQVLRGDPENGRAHYLLGTLDLESGRGEQGLSRLERAVGLEPSSFEIQRSFAQALLSAGRMVEALDAFRRAAVLNPNELEPCLELVPLLERHGLFEEAERFASRAVSLDPEHAVAHAWLGNLRLKLRKFEGALECFQRALALDPSLARVHEVLGFALSKLGRLQECRTSLERAFQLDPSLHAAQSQFVFLGSFSPDSTPETLLGEASQWSLRHAAPLVARRRPHPHGRASERRLRIAYVSPDFREHVQRCFVPQVLRRHDRLRFEVVCYSSVAYPDAWTERIKAQADVWHDVAVLSDSELAEKIRADRIDVLVDLTMHMGNHRLRTFAEKPAPVQITWLAYPGTTGVDGMDYRLSDPHLDPPGSALPYSEQTLRLPNTFWCYDPGTNEPAVTPLPSLEAGYVTFGNLNNFLKVSRAALELWARVLGTLPDSRFLLLAPSGFARDLAIAVFEEQGVSRERLTFVGPQSPSDYLATYQRIDVGLDCFPYNGHTSSLDAFWMGVPVVTLVGRTVVGRAGLSQASNLGLPELVARSPDEFVDVAVDLARDLPRLSALRRELRQRLTSSPLMDADRFTRALETAYRDAWQRFCQARP